MRRTPGYDGISRATTAGVLVFAAACTQHGGGDASGASSGKAAATGVSVSPVATASVAGAAPLAKRFAGPSPQGIPRSGQKLGIPNGWQAGEFGEVRTANKDGYAAAYDLPQFPPQPLQVELRTKSLGCKTPSLDAAVDGGIGTKKVPAKIYQGTWYV